MRAFHKKSKFVKVFILIRIEKDIEVEDKIEMILSFILA